MVTTTFLSRAGMLALISASAFACSGVDDSESNIQSDAGSGDGFGDCRQVGQACTSGFVCQEVYLGTWECVVDNDPIGGNVGGQGGGEPDNRCGDGNLGADEQCDDSNTRNGDGCDSQCQVEEAPSPVCGNGDLEAGEDCDDGNRRNGDGCDSQCQAEAAPVCGNGDREAGEECDDGNRRNGDGCDSQCQAEAAPVCGNGIQEAGEECDDGNRRNGDGCDASCRPEALGVIDISAGGDFPAGFGDAGGNTFVFTLRGPTQTYLETSDGAGGCPGDTVMSLSRIDLAGQPNIVAENDDSVPGISVCSLLDLPLDAGNYEVTVAGYSGAAVPAYVLRAEFSPVAAATRVVSSRLNYQPRGINANRDDWGDSFVSPAGSLTVRSYSAAVGDYIDNTMTGADGSFTIRVPEPSVDGDAVFFFAVVVDDAGNPVFGVAEPQVGDGVQNLDPAPDAGANARFHSTSIESSLLDAMPEDFYLPVESSGWMRLFDHGRYIYNSMTDFAGAPGASLVIWLRYGTSWTCGACAAPWQTRVGDRTFDSQIWIPADDDQSFWGDAVTTHEISHWIMSSFGRDPEEGGPHTLAIPTLPGQAWSEGFATWVSSVVRGNSVFYDKQDGTFFWFDLVARRHPNGAAFIAPDPNGSVLQWMDEIEVAAELWMMTLLTLDDPGAAPSLQNGFQPYFRALTSPQMQGPGFGRGYSRHTWELDANRQPVNVRDTGEPAPCYADYLDAVRCIGAISADDMLLSLNGFPFDPYQPYCP